MIKLESLSQRRENTVAENRVTKQSAEIVPSEIGLPGFACNDRSFFGNREFSRHELREVSC